MSTVYVCIVGLPYHLRTVSTKHCRVILYNSKIVYRMYECMYVAQQGV
jgi:hypothetical protein